MKRQTALAVAAAPLLVLSLAIAAQAVPSDDPSAPVTETSPAEATEVPTEGAPTDTSTSTPTDGTDPAAVPSDDTAPSEPVQSEEDGAAAVEPNAALPDATLPDAVAPAEGDLERPADPALAAADVQISLASTDLVAGAVLVSGYVTEVEEGGTCSLTLTRGAEVLTIEAPAEADATTTVCGGLTMTTTGLALGDWSATIGYDSPTRSGVSAATTVTIR
ncbi:hypothetical protein [Sanguibacter sp. Leaf3]|uniref:hypothetical protein n=1 Tax=Sanguibacter sp. Leaf3 TaxID=1736209 RepID=UPI0006F8B76D|nr:hypothetical protein [Sanguibacter sp. Leaf3]KQT95877.1 hypothetical protein ASG53_18470 [Sanguibacter sp. Leaf3]